MKLEHLLIWFKDGEARVSGLAKLPEAFAYEGRTFLPLSEYLGDVDYLRDAQNRLMGFAFTLGDSEWEEAVCETLIAQNKNVKREDGMLMIFLQSGDFQIQGVQATGTEIFRSSTNEIMLRVPNWGFRKLAFKLTTTDTPLTTSVPHERWKGNAGESDH